MRTQHTTTGPDINILNAFAEILELAASEPGSIDEANETLYAIEDAAAEAAPTAAEVSAALYQLVDAINADEDTQEHDLDGHDEDSCALCEARAVRQKLYRSRD